MPQSYHLRIGDLLTDLLMVCFAKKIDMHLALDALIYHSLAQQNANNTPRCCFTLLENGP